MKKTSILKKKIKSLLAEADIAEKKEFEVVFYGLTRNREGSWEVNDAIIAGSDFSLDELLDFAEGRWEIFKLNYLPKARIKNLEDTGYETKVNLEVDNVSFLSITAKS